MDKDELLKELNSLIDELDKIDIAIERIRYYLNNIINDVELYLVDAES